MTNMLRSALLLFAIIIVIGGVWFVGSLVRAHNLAVDEVARPSAAPTAVAPRNGTRTELAAPPKESNAVAPIAKTPTAPAVEAPKSSVPTNADATAALLKQYKSDGKELLAKFRASPTPEIASELATLIVQANLDLDGKSVAREGGGQFKFPPHDKDHRSMLSGSSDQTGDHSRVYAFSRTDFPIYFDVEEFKNAPIGTFDAEKQKQLVSNLTDQAEKTLARLDQH